MLLLKRQNYFGLNGTLGLSKDDQAFDTARIDYISSKYEQIQV